MEKIGRFRDTQQNPMNGFASFSYFLHQCLQLLIRELLYVCEFQLIFFLRFSTVLPVEQREEQHSMKNVTLPSPVSLAQVTE